MVYTIPPIVKTQESAILSVVIVVMAFTITHKNTGAGNCVGSNSTILIHTIQPQLKKRGGVIYNATIIVTLQVKLPVPVCLCVFGFCVLTRDDMM